MIEETRTEPASKQLSTHHSLHQRTSLIALIFLGKLIVASITPFSRDFLEIIKSSTISLGTYAPYALLERGLYMIWIFLPIAHPRAASQLGFGFFVPAPETVLLVALLKLPTVVADLTVGLLIFHIASEMHFQFAGRAMLAWLFNPFVWYAGVMWGGAEIVAVSLFLAGLYALNKLKVLPGGILFSLSASIRLLPLILVPYALRVHRSRAALSKAVLVTLTSLLFAALIVNAIANPNPFLGSSGSPLGQRLSDIQLVAQSPQRTFAISIGVTALAVALLHSWGRARTGDWSTFLWLQTGATAIVFSVGVWTPPDYLWIVAPFTLLSASRQRAFEALVGYSVTLLLWCILYYASAITLGAASFLFIPGALLDGLSELGRAFLAISGTTSFRMMASLSLSVLIAENLILSILSFSRFFKL